MKPVAISLVLASALTFAAAPSFAQTVARTAGGDDPAPSAPGPYAGAEKPAFYDVEARVAALETRISAMAGGAARSMRAQLNGVKAFIAQQKARHGGELRDWDREHATARLNRIESMG